MTQPNLSRLFSHLPEGFTEEDDPFLYGEFCVYVGLRRGKVVVLWRRKGSDGDFELPTSPYFMKAVSRAPGFDGWLFAAFPDVPFSVVFATTPEENALLIEGGEWH